MKSIISIALIIIVLLSIYLMNSESPSNPATENNKLENKTQSKNTEIDAELTLTTEPNTQVVPKKSMEPKDEKNNIASDDIKLSNKQVLKLLGDKKALEWQQQYDKKVYEPDYDITWKDDMLSEAYNLITTEKYQAKMQISEFNCQQDECKINMSDLSENSANLGDYSKFMLDLKNHPAILKSGNKRNVYLESVKVKKNRRLVTLSIR